MPLYNAFKKKNHRPLKARSQHADFATPSRTYPISNLGALQVVWGRQHFPLIPGYMPAWTSAGHANGPSRVYNGADMCPLIYPPTLIKPQAWLRDLWGAENFPINSICMGFFKNRLTSTKIKVGFAHIRGLGQIFFYFNPYKIRTQILPSQMLFITARTTRTAHPTYPIKIFNPL